MRFDPQQPFNDLPLLPPKADIETKPVLKKAISANRALAELKGVGDIIPNQAVLLTSLVLQEARSSSEIENIVTTDDALFRAFTANTTRPDPATKEVLNYREALWTSFNALQKRPLLTTNLFIKLVQTIKGNTAGIRRVPGIKVKSIATGKIVYTPPEGKAIIRSKLKNLEDYIHADNTVDPLIRMAVVHYQFEAVHPFADGNGRTGRIVNILFLVLKGLLDLPVLYLSKYVIQYKGDYYNLLRRVTEREEWEPWILYMLDAVEVAALAMKKKIIGIRDLMTETMEYARKRLPERVYSKELIELLFRQPYVKGQFLVESGIAKRQTAAEYLRELEKIGVLKAHKSGKERLYLNVKLYDQLSG